MQSCVPSLLAKHVVEMINHFGFPLRILSRLPQDIVHKVSLYFAQFLSSKFTVEIYRHKEEVDKRKPQDEPY